jgi:hypothetical protein
MGWISAFSQLVGTLAWPTAVLALALLFRHQLRGLLERAAKIEFPGGSITMQDVTRFEKERRRCAGAAGRTRHRTRAASDLPRHQRSSRPASD